MPKLPVASVEPEVHPWHTLLLLEISKIAFHLPVNRSPAGIAQSNQGIEQPGNTWVRRERNASFYSEEEMTGGAGSLEGVSLLDHRGEYRCS